MAVEVIARVLVGGEQPVGRLVCHPRLPLVAGEQGPEARVWDFGDGQLREAGVISAEADGRSRWPFALHWEPGGSLLLAANKRIRGTAGTVARWSTAGVAALDGLPSTDDYDYLAFAPDGRALWASPSRQDHQWALSDIVDLASGVVWAGQRWDTGIAVHPGGGLVATLASEAGGTAVVFGRVERDRAPAALRLLCRAAELNSDGYVTPAFSPDGRYLAIRGSSYGEFLDVFEFPSLRHVLNADLDPWRPGMSSQEHRDRWGAWSRDDIAFGAQPGVLWAGTPAGILTEIDLDRHQMASHDVLHGAPVTALAAAASGDLVVATGPSPGGLALVRVAADPAAPDPAALRAQVAAFLASTSVVPDDRDLWASLVTDGPRAGRPSWRGPGRGATEWLT